MAVKRGKLSEQELEYIRNNYINKSVSEIATKLKRSESLIKKTISNLSETYTRPDKPLAVEYDLKRRGWYKTLETQFTEHELVIIESIWNDLIRQFKSDVAFSEEMQILDLCKLEIIMDRDLVNLKRHHVRLEEISAKIDSINSLLKNKNLSSDEIKELEEERLDQEALYGTLTSASEQITKATRENQDKKNKMLEKLKSTRAQRTERLEKSGENFRVFLAKLVEDKETREEVGLEMEKLRVAKDIERKRLTQKIEFADGELDYPIFNSEVLLAEENNDEEKEV